MAEPTNTQEEAQARRALLYMLEDLEREREALHRAHRQWVETVDAVPDPMMVHDERFCVVRANHAYAERSGLSFPELIGRPYWECFPKRAGPSPECRHAIASGDTQAAPEAEFTLETGEIFISRTFRVADAETGRKLCLHLFEDVTANRRAAEALRKSHQMLERIFETTHFGIVYLDKDFNFIRVNRAYAEGCKQRPEFFPGKNHFALFPHAENEAIFRRVVQTGETFSILAKPFEFPDQPERGTTYWDWTLHPLKDERGNVESLVFVLLDVTQTHRSMHALERVNRALRTLSAGNTALVRANNEASLLKEMCRIVVEVGGYRSALVGYAQSDAGKSIDAVAWHGIDDDDVRGAKATWADDDLGRGPLATAIRTGKVQLMPDALGDQRYEPWRSVAESSGFRSVVAFPLLRTNHASRPFGALAIGAPGSFDEQEINLLTELAADLAYGIESLRMREERQEAGRKLARALEATVETMAATMEKRDPYTAGHQRRVAELACAIANEMGLDQATIEGIHYGALIHDLGKIQIPAEILSKPSRLIPLELELIKTHAKSGYEIVKNVDFPWPVAAMVHQHHERMDGTGYPQGLKGDAIALEARLLAVADVVEAMSSHRPYRPGLGIESALKEIEEKRGTAFDERAVDACLRLFREKGFRFA